MLLVIFPSAANAIVTSDVPGSHVVAPGVPAFSVNLDGVAFVGGLFAPEAPTRIGSAALISDRHVLTAAHTFDRNRDGQLESPLAPFTSLNAVVFQLAGGWVAVRYDFRAVQVPDNWPAERADIAVITLAEAAPPEIPRYSLYGGTNEVGRAAVFAGYGYGGYGATGESPSLDAVPTKRAGLNRIDSVRDDLPGVEFLASDFDSGLAANNALDLIGFESDLGFGADEVMKALGDSGGPVFIDGAIAAVNALGSRLLAAADVNSLVDASWGEFSFDTRVSNFRDFILTATGGTAVFVPEPSSLSQGIVIAFAAAVPLRRRYALPLWRWQRTLHEIRDSPISSNPA